MESSKYMHTNYDLPTYAVGPLKPCMTSTRALKACSFRMFNNKLAMHSSDLDRRSFAIVWQTQTHYMLLCGRISHLSQADISIEKMSKPLTCLCVFLHVSELVLKCHGEHE